MSEGTKRIGGSLVSESIFWKLLERFGVVGVQFVLQLVLARLLNPSHYGTLSIMIIFTSLANVFIQTGFNTALIQNKDVTEEDYSSVLWVSLMIAAVMYGIIFCTAPVIGFFYLMEEIVRPLRVLALMLFPGAWNSVLLAKVSRELDFKKVFVSNLAAIIVSGIVGIGIALLDGGLWALVVQSLLNVTVSCVVMQFSIRLKIKFICNWRRIKILFGFGSRILISTFINTIYRDLHSMVIGKKYNSGALGYYTRGQQFPQFFISAIDGAVQSVMLPVMSTLQDDTSQLKEMARTTIRVSSYVVFPAMFGLAAVAEPLICLLLTEKWLPCVPYLRVYCISFAFYPVHSANLQAINAMGRSDLFLKLEIIKKVYGVIALIIAVYCFDSPLAIAMTSVITTIISCFVNASPNKKLINYSYIEQMKDIIPVFVLSTVMFGIVYVIGLLSLSNLLIMTVQIIVGMIFYIATSHLLKLQSYRFLLNMVKSRQKQVDKR